MPRAGNGSPTQAHSDISVDELMTAGADTNSELLFRLRENAHSDVLPESCREDARLGRMREPRKVELSELCESRFSPRLGVVQGERAMWDKALHTRCKLAGTNQMAV